MHLPKLSFRNGLLVSMIAGASWSIGWPLLYDKYGQGAADTRAAVLASSDITLACKSSPKFTIVPWQLGLEDSELSGKLEIGYWVRCSGGSGRLHMNFYHTGSSWILESGFFSMDGFTKTFASTAKEIVTK